MRKASVSITANIALGYGRFHFRDSMQFYLIARGSLYELKDDLITCYDLDYTSQETYEKGIDLIESAKLILNGYINFVGKKVKE